MTSPTSLPSRISNYLAAVIHPLLPAMLGSGAIRLILTLSAAFGLVTVEDPSYSVLQAVGDGFFYFFPILLAYSIAKRQGSSQPLAILAAAILLHPDLTALLTSEKAAFLGISVKEVIYPASVLPIFLLTLLMKPIEQLAERITPSLLKGFMKPLIVLLTAILLALWVIGPFVRLVGNTLAAGFHYLYKIADWAALLLLSLIMPLLILLGFHHWVVEPADSGPWSVALLSATLALGGIALATLRSRDRDTRKVALGASLTVWAGIPEPAAYGTALRGFPLLSASIAAGVGGLYSAFTDTSDILSGELSPIFALIQAAGRDGYRDLFNLSIGLLIPMLIGLGLGLLTLRPRRSNRTVRAHRQTGTAVDAFDKIDTPTGEANMTFAPISFVSPISGRVIPLSRVSDPAFASGVMGQGCAILPDFGKVYAPCDGFVTSVSAGKNALSIDSIQGVQLFIHIGIDSVNLSAHHFDLCCRTGDAVKQGDLLLSFDMEALSKEGADLTTPLLVVNMDRYDDLSLTCESQVKAGDRLLTLTPKG